MSNSVKDKEEEMSNQEPRAWTILYKSLILL